MANFNRSEEARRNRLSAIRDDPIEPLNPSPVAPDPYEGRSQLYEACTIRTDRIMADPDQPRKEFDVDAMSRLAGSIQSRGQLQPIRVRWDQARGMYVVVVGERRWRAARLLDLEAVACVVVPGEPGPAEILEDQLVENALREGLRPVEQARAYRTLLDTLGLTQAQLAARLRISPASVTHALALLDLPEAVRARVEEGTLSPSAAYEVAKVDDPQTQVDLAETIAVERLNRAETIAAVRRSASKPKGRGAAARPVKPRVFRTAHGKATIEPRKGSTVADVLRAALAQAEGQGGETEAA